MMEKKEMKKIEITEIKKHHLSSYQDVTGEYETNCNVDFMISEKLSFSIFDKEYNIDRIKMSVVWDETILQYANEDKTYCCFPVSKVFVHKIMNKVIEEQKDGLFKGWVFHDELMEILQGENESTHCFY